MAERFFYLIPLGLNSPTLAAQGTSISAKRNVSDARHLALSESLGDNYIRLQPQILDESGSLKAADLADMNPELLVQYEEVAAANGTNLGR